MSEPSVETSVSLPGWPVLTVDLDVSETPCVVGNFIEVRSMGSVNSFVDTTVAGILTPLDVRW